MRVAVLIVALALVGTAPAAAQTPVGGVLSDSSTGPNGASLNGHVTALAIGPDGSVYAGGGFTMAGGAPASHVARWDGMAWSALGEGVVSTAGPQTRVDALAFGPDGSLYVGGIFDTAGGIAARHIARWDGTAWSALGDGVDGPELSVPGVQALAFGPDGFLYAGGSFATAGGVPARNVARWDGAGWHALGTGTDLDVCALAFAPDGSLYAAGNLRMAGGLPAGRIARWDGTTWSALGSVGLTDGLALSLAVGLDGSVTVGGKFVYADGLPVNRVAQWDGTAWSALGTPPAVGVNKEAWALAVGQDGALYAGGEFWIAGTQPARGVAQWDGSAWSTVGVGIGPVATLYALAVAPDGTLYAGGHSIEIGAQPLAFIAAWDGSEWRGLDEGVVGAVPDADPGLGLVLAIAPNPTRGSATATVTHAAGPLTLEVMDALGRRVAVVTDAAAVSGTRTLTLPLDGVAPGVYVVRVQGGREVVAQTLVILR